MGSAVDSFIQDYCNANHIDLGARKVCAMGSGDTFVISTFQTGSAAQITLGGDNWNDFFANSQYSGIDEDKTENRHFSISDGTNSVDIVLDYDVLNMDGLVAEINTQIGTSVLVRAEQVDDNHFKMIPQSGAKTITINGVDKLQFFEN